MSHPIARYDDIIMALLAEEDNVTRKLFDPDFVVHEDTSMPHGGDTTGGDGMGAMLSATGLPGGPVDGLETFVTVHWLFRDRLALEARVFYYGTPALAAALTRA